MHHRHWPLKTFTALRSPFSPTQRRNQGYFFHSAFMSKGASECVIWSGELSVGRQLALDSMKDLAIHSSFSLVDRNIIRGIIVECGCRRGAKRSHRAIVIERLASFTFSRICSFSLRRSSCMETRSERGRRQCRINRWCQSWSFAFSL